MESISIKIDKAKIKSVHVYATDNGPNVCATISLMAGNIKISEFNIDTAAWDMNKQFVMSQEAAQALELIMAELETLAVIKCNATLGLLTEGEL